MSGEIKLGDVRLAYTEDPYQRRLEVLRTASLDVRSKGLEGRVGMIAKKIDARLSRLQRLEKWPAYLVVLALDHLVEAYCGTIYEFAKEAEVSVLEEEDADPPRTTEDN